MSYRNWKRGLVSVTEFNEVLIETVNLKKNFGDLQVLKGISEKIYKGEVTLRILLGGVFLKSRIIIAI